MAEKENKTKEPMKRRWNYKKIAGALIILIVLLALILVFFVFDLQFTKIWHKIQGEGQNFTYNNMTFTKTFFGNLLLYQTDLAIYRPVQDNTIYWQLKLRNDPRVLDKNIAVNLTDKLTRKIYISFAREPLECEGIMLTAYRLGEFTDALGAYTEAAFSNEELAKENNNSYPVKNCDDAKGDWSVILLKQSNANTSYIHQQNSCFVLEIANCEHIEVSERFLLALIDTMKKPAQENMTNENNQSNSS
jgi:hypothetical protein